MRKTIQMLLTGLLLLSAGTTSMQAGQNNRTFHRVRSELDYSGIDWTHKNHSRTKKRAKTLGTNFMVTTFFGTSTQGEKLGKTFGLHDESNITVTLPDAADIDEGRYIDKNIHTHLSALSIDHGPNTDHVNMTDESGTPTAPMHGVMNIKPARTVWGTRLNVVQSLESIYKGLSIEFAVPLVNVKTSLRAEENEVSRGSLTQVGTDGFSDSWFLADYFTGGYEKPLSLTTHVQQDGLQKARLSNKTLSETGLGGLQVRLRHDSSLRIKEQAFSLGVGATVVLSADKTQSGEYLFQPTAGNGNHTALGLFADAQTKVWHRNGIRVDVAGMVDYKYLLQGDENRTLGIRDIARNTDLPGGHFSLMMRNGFSGVFPAANVLTRKVSVTPGSQVETLLGVCAQWQGITFDLGYNMFWRSKETISQVYDWSNDTYALAHPLYSMSTAALGTKRLGGRVPGTDDYSDTNSPVAKHKHLIGANRDSWDDGVVGPVTAPTEDGPYPGAFTSQNGPIQETADTASNLIRRDVDATTGVDKDGSGLQKVHYALSTDAATAGSYMTHSVVTGASYKLSGSYPVIFGLGGQYEFGENNADHRSLSNYRLWFTCGMNF